MKDRVIIIGTGGHAKVITDILLASNTKIMGFLDDYYSDSEFLGHSVLGKISNIQKYKDEAEFIIAIGDNATRKRISSAYSAKWYTAIHPSAVISDSAIINEGTVVMPNVVINSSAVIGNHCIINTSSVIEHDCVVNDYVHISPNATLCGTVSVGENTHIAAGVTVINNISICSNCIIGAGATVVRNINDSGLYVGNPCKKIKEN